MTELLKNAWMGWQDYKTYGKLAALFIAALFYLLMRGEKREGSRRFVLYAAVMGVLCVLPLTAIFFMGYQTRFYDYEWIWSYVPVTAVTAMAGTCFVLSLWRQRSARVRDICRNAVLTAIVISIFFLCGTFGSRQDSLARERQQREKACEILRAMEEPGSGECCLWAPKEILEYARIYRTDATLLYGRNMWDASLNAYSYDTYSSAEEELYLWMEELAETGEWIQEYEDEEGTHIRDGSACVEGALELGVNNILLPDTTPPEALSELEGADWMPERLRITRLGDYYLLRVG